MFPKGLDQKLLHAMYQRHVSQLGHSTSNLHESKVFVAGFADGDTPLKLGIIAGAHSGSLILQAARELERKGLVVFNFQDSAFWLTPAGFDASSRNRWQRTLAFFNENAGLAIPVAVLSLLVSVIALFVGGR